jgi:hypothetical protein
MIQKIEIIYYTMEKPKKYVMANIKIPIEVKENNKCEPYMDLLNMEITELDSLPESTTDPILKDQLKNNLYIFLSKMFPDIPVTTTPCESEPESEKTEITLEKEIQLYVEKEELKKLKKPMNTTFKNYNKKSCKKYTSKNYDSNGR